MRVDLFYDLLRFSPRSIDLFISMNISPPQSTQTSPKANKTKANNEQGNRCQRLLAFALPMELSRSTTSAKSKRNNTKTSRARTPSSQVLPRHAAKSPSHRRDKAKSPRQNAKSINATKFANRLRRSLSLGLAMLARVMAKSVDRFPILSVAANLPYKVY